MLNIKNILLTVSFFGSALAYGQQSVSLEQVLQEINKNNPLSASSITMEPG